MAENQAGAHSLVLSRGRAKEAVGMPNVFNIGRSGMAAAKTGISTAGHNISNVNTEGFSRQRVNLANEPQGSLAGRNMIGKGVLVDRVERLNDQYIEKQIRDHSTELGGFEEKDLILKQLEDIFNELDGDGLNHVVTRFFNEFRKLSNDPDSEAVRHSAKEATISMVADFRRMRKEIEEVRKHIDSRIEGHILEINSIGDEIRDLNNKIKEYEMGGVAPNDLLDRRDLMLKKLSQYLDLSMHKSDQGDYIIDIKGMGPFVVGGQAEKFSVRRSPASIDGKPEAALDVILSSNVNSILTHHLKGGKLGALIETRDKMLSSMLDRVDSVAFTLTAAVNQLHSQGVTRRGEVGVPFFKVLDQKSRAAEFMDISGDIKESVDNIATAVSFDSPGDNRVALAISNLQSSRLMNGGHTTMDDFFNAMVSEVGVAVARNRAGFEQQKNIVTQLGKMREQLSGVSVDEETANLLQFQHAFDASAKVIQVANGMLDTVMELTKG